MDVNREVKCLWGGRVRSGVGGGWGSKVLGRWVMWGMGDVNQELEKVP